MSAVILSHIFVLGYGQFFVDALMVMTLAVVYLWQTRRHSHRGKREGVETTAAYERAKRYSRGDYLPWIEDLVH